MAVGCPGCRGQDDTALVCCVYGDEEPDIPAETCCDACGRVIPCRFLLIRYDINMKPPDM